MVSRNTLALLASALPSTFANYTLTKDYSGLKFFESFSFFTDADPTSGFVDFLDETTANASSLVGYVNTGVNPLAAYMAVDTVNVSPNGRPSVRILDKTTYNHALFVIDISHMPQGCGVWPAFWLLGTSSTWPAAGEIDIIEGVNLQASNLMTLHTNAGVSLNNSSDSMTGTIETSDCDVSASSNNLGCQISDASIPFGEQFNLNGGGIFATEYTSEAIKIWYWGRNTSTPADVLTNPDPKSWPAPNALFENASGDLDSHFCEMQMIFDTTFCGDWAGNAQVWADSECSAVADSCHNYVQNSPSAFTEAYWAINTLKVFQDSSQGLGSKAKRYAKRRAGAVLPM